VKLDNPNIDEILDAVLKHYGKVEPRAGLEQRVLARMHAGEPAPRQAWWWVVSAATTAVALAVGGLISLHPARMDSTALRSAKTAAPPPIAFIRARREGQGLRRTRRLPRLSSPDRLEAVSLNAPPKLEQFPSPLPLSEQEQLLALYVRKFHREAVFMARVQTQEWKKETSERGHPAAGEEVPTNSTQQP
jgi:hypothetical protein